MLNYVLTFSDENHMDYLFFKEHPDTKLLNNKDGCSKSVLTDELKYRILSHNSLASKNVRTVSAALLFKDYEFYCPMFLDWRGRLYTMNSLLSYQGDELTKSLLYFSKDKGQILNAEGLIALKIYIANCFGLNKISYYARLEWVENNMKSILSLDWSLISKAKDKLLFVAAILELKQYQENPNTFISRLPIFIDATCNGLQHLSSIIGDLNLANYVNLTRACKKDKPNDVYEFISEVIKVRLSKYKEEDSIKYEYGFLEGVKINRNFIKRCIMTVPYGVSISGMKDQLIEDHFIKVSIPVSIITSNSKKKKVLYKFKTDEFLENKEDIELKYLEGKEIYKLGKLIHSSLYETYPNLTKLVKYLKEMNILFKRFNLGNMWKTPTGLILEQKYLKQTKEVVIMSIGGKKKSYTMAKNIDVININKQHNAIVPNIIHSFDAGNITNLVKRLKKKNLKYPLITIHDCFATDANNIISLSLQVKYAFADIYRNKDFIDEYHKFAINHIESLGFVVKDGNIILADGTSISIPRKPDFVKEFDLDDNIAKANYFLN